MKLISSILLFLPTHGSAPDCEVFSMDCSTTDGFTITVNEDCRNNRFPTITDNSEFYIFGMEDPLKEEDYPVGGLTSLTAPCKLDNGVAVVGFDECGETQFNEGDSFNTMSTYVHHRTSLMGFELTTMPAYKLECQLSNVNFEEDSGGPVVEIADYEEFDAPTSVTNIPPEELRTTFGLGLEAGRLDTNGDFVALDENAALVVGSSIYIELQKKDGITNFNFALRDCSASSSGSEISLYDAFCPNQRSAVVGLEATSLEQFKINIFRIRMGQRLTFECNIAIFPADEQLPDVENCSDLGGGADGGNVSTRKKRSNENFTCLALIPVTIDL